MTNTYSDELINVRNILTIAWEIAKKYNNLNPWDDTQKGLWNDFIKQTQGLYNSNGNDDSALAILSEDIALSIDRYITNTTREKHH